MLMAGQRFEKTLFDKYCFRYEMDEISLDKG